MPSQEQNKKNGAVSIRKTDEDTVREEESMESMTGFGKLRGGFHNT